MITTDSLTSTDGIAADIIDGNVLLVSVDGPVTPFVVANTLKATAGFVQKFHDNDINYGSILHVDKEAMIFSESIELFISATKDYKNRKCIAFVMQKDVYGSALSGLIMKELYTTKIPVPFEVFTEDRDAIQWVKSILADK